jgi:hypothetical protein
MGVCCMGCVMFCVQVAACEEDIDRLHASRATAQAEAEEADAAAQQALETGHAEVIAAAAQARKPACPKPLMAPEDNSKHASSVTFTGLRHFAAAAAPTEHALSRAGSCLRDTSHKILCPGHAFLYPAHTLAYNRCRITCR